MHLSKARLCILLVVGLLTLCPHEPHCRSSNHQVSFGSTDEMAGSVLPQKPRRLVEAVSFKQWRDYHWKLPVANQSERLCVVAQRCRKI
ncbi:hypothetical protein PSPO01_05594 [Paraphaeosphaeria sporulosa]